MNKNTAITFFKNYSPIKNSQMFLYILGSVIAGFLEITGVALVYPFILLISNPLLLENHKYKNLLPENPIFFIGLMIVLMFLAKNIFMIWFTYLQNKFAMLWKTNIKDKFVKFFLFGNYSKVISIPYVLKQEILNNYTNFAVDNFVLRALSICTNIIVVTLIGLFLFIKFPTLSIILISTFTLSLIILNKIFSQKTFSIGQNLVNSSQKWNESLFYISKNIKETISYNQENYYYEQNISAQKKYNKEIMKQNFLSMVPTYIMELVSILAIGVVTFYILKTSPERFLAIMGVLSAAIFRIAPSLNKIQIAYNLINSTTKQVQILNEKYNEYELWKDFSKQPETRLYFNSQIELKNIDFAYGDKKVLKNFNLTINKGEFIAIIGESGAGKSTLADIIMGLLSPENGEILLDGEKISNNTDLRSLVSYIPQNVNLTNKSIAENISMLNEKSTQIKINKIKKVMELANINHLSPDYRVSENNLSLGQQQRITIARALYQDREILLLDEATSALDRETEKAILETLQQLKGQKTIIAITHKSAFLEYCDKIIEIKNITY